MAFALKATDQINLDRLLEAILDAFKQGVVTRSQAQYALGHVISTAAMDNETELRDWLETDRVERWKEECRKARPTSGK